MAVNNKNVLVTGSEGYIGSVLMPMLLEAGWHATGLDCCYYAHGNLDGSYSENWPVVRKDIRDLTPADFENFDAVVHLAALSNDPLGKLDETLTMEVNFLASEHLAQAAKSAGAKRFVYASSCSLYGAADRILTEDDPANPQTAYGRSKIMTENALTGLADTHFCPVFLRNATAFGLSPRMRFDIVVNSLTGYAHTTNNIRILGDGTPWRPLVHVRDICRGILLALQARDAEVCAQAFNIGDSSENFQIRSIAEHVQHYYPACSISIAQANANDTRNYMVSFEKAQRILGFHSTWSLDRGIDELRRAFISCGLTYATFQSPTYTRLLQIEEWKAQGKLDSALRWSC